MIPYLCPKCQTPVGFIVEQNGQLWLNSGGWLLAEARRHCHVCGSVVYFKRPKKTMAELMAGRETLALLDVWTLEVVR